MSVFPTNVCIPDNVRNADKPERRGSGSQVIFWIQSTEGAQLWVWDLKDKGHPVHLKWNILHTTKPYKAGMKTCDLCLLEKTRILLGRDGPEKIPNDVVLLNRRTEVTAKCRHKLKYTLEADYWRRIRRKKPGWIHCHKITTMGQDRIPAPVQTQFL